MNEPVLMSDLNAPPTTRWRTWLLRGIAGLIVICGLLYCRERFFGIRAAVEQAGGKYYQIVPNPVLTQLQLSWCYGDSFHATQIVFEPGTVDDAWLHRNRAKLTDLPSLELTLDGTQLTDRGLRELQNLKNIRSLILRGTQVTDASLPAINSLSGLEVLDVSQTAISDRGLAGLKPPHQELRLLELDRRQLTDLSMNHLQNFKGIGFVHLIDADDESITRLAQLPVRLNVAIQGKDVTNKSIPVLVNWLKNRSAMNVVMLVDVSLTPEEFQELCHQCPNIGMSFVPSQFYYGEYRRSLHGPQKTRLW